MRRQRHAQSAVGSVAGTSRRSGPAASPSAPDSGRRRIPRRLCFERLEPRCGNRNGPHMRVFRIVIRGANPGSQRCRADRLGVEVGGTPKRYPDGELRPLGDTPEGRQCMRGDVYLPQPTAPRVTDHLVELLLLLDACAGRARQLDRGSAVFRRTRRRRRGAATLLRRLPTYPMVGTLFPWARPRVRRTLMP